MDSMSVRLLQVFAEVDEFPLERVLGLLDGLPLADRLRELNGERRVRAEVVERPTPQRPYWRLGFTRLRSEHGPGRANANTPIVPFEMGKGDSFGEETAALFVPRSNLLVLQQNRMGINRTGLESYFAQVAATNGVRYQIVSALDPTVQAKLATGNIFRKFTLKVAPANIGPAMRRQNVSLGRVVELGDAFNAPILEISMSVGHSNGHLNRSAVREAVNYVQRLLRQAAPEDEEMVLGASITAKNGDDADAKSEVLDLIAPTMKRTFDNLVKDAGLRFTQQSRFRALEDALAEWQRRE